MLAFDFENLFVTYIESDLAVWLLTSCILKFDDQSCVPVMVQFVQGFVRVCVLIWEYLSSTYFYHSMLVTSGLRHYVFWVVCPSFIMNVKFGTDVNFDLGWSLVIVNSQYTFLQVIKSFFVLFCILIDIVYSIRPPQVHWFCWYWASGMCWCTMWWSSLSVLCTPL